MGFYPNIKVLPQNPMVPTQFRPKHKYSHFSLKSYPSVMAYSPMFESFPIGWDPSLSYTVTAITCEQFIHQLWISGTLDCMKSRFRRLGFHETPTSGAVDFMKTVASCGSYFLNLYNNPQFGAYQSSVVREMSLPSCIFCVYRLHFVACRGVCRMFPSEWDT